MNDYHTDRLSQSVTAFGMKEMGMKSNTCLKRLRPGLLTLIVALGLAEGEVETATEVSDDGPPQVGDAGQ